MDLKFVCLAAFALVCINLNQVESAPRTKSLADFSQDDLAEKFAEFLHQDKEMASILDYYKEAGAHSLVKRQAVVKLDTDEDVTQMAESGFLDRAAKFVLEIVQRFLKWINTD